MPNSIRTTSKTNTTTNHTPATFKAGDSVLCPSVGNGTYQLFNDKEYDCLGFTINSKTYHYRNDGKVSRDDAAPSLFHDTKADDKEVIVISSHDLSHIACDISGAITILNDIGQLLALIHYEKVEPHTVISMARLTHDAADTWATLLNDQLEALNEPLVMTGYKREVAR